jgi:two-component system chemotaxis response regulator CheY
MAYYDLRKLSVLVVEDSGFMAKLLRVILRGLAVGRVEECLNPGEVLNHVREYLPDLVFLDLDMPGMDGLEVTKQLRSSDDTPNPFIPIVMVTAHTRALNVVAARDAGVTEYLAKPVSSRAVYDRLVACIETARPFIKTKTFYGPDRRRRNEPHDGAERRQVRRAS